MFFVQQNHKEMKLPSDLENDSIYEGNANSVYDEYYTRYADYIKNDNNNRKKKWIDILKNKWWLLLSILMLMIAGMAFVLSVHLTAATVITVTEATTASVMELATTSVTEPTTVSGTEVTISSSSTPQNPKEKAVFMLKDPVQIVFGLNGKSFFRNFRNRN